MARLAPPSLAVELLHSEDEGTSGAADTDLKQRQAALAISIKQNGVNLTQGKNSCDHFGNGLQSQVRGGQTLCIVGSQFE